MTAPARPVATPLIGFGQVRHTRLRPARRPPLRIGEHFAKATRHRVHVDACLAKFTLDLFARLTIRLRAHPRYFWFDRFIFHIRSRSSCR